MEKGFITTKAEADIKLTETQEKMEKIVDELDVFESDLANATDDTEKSVIQRKIDNAKSSFRDVYYYTQGLRLSYPNLAD